MIVYEIKSKINPKKREKLFQRNNFKFLNKKLSEGMK